MASRISLSQITSVLEAGAEVNALCMDPETGEYVQPKCLEPAVRSRMRLEHVSCLRTRTRGRGAAYNAFFSLPSRRVGELPDALVPCMREVRLARKASQAKVASEVGVPAKDYKAVEDGEAACDLVLALRIARALSCDVGDLYMLVGRSEAARDEELAAYLPPVPASQEAD